MALSPVIGYTVTGLSPITEPWEVVVGIAVIYESFGGPEVLQVREVPEPHAGPGEVRIRVASAGLNPMDWGIAARPELAAAFGISVPAGFGSDLAGTVDEVGYGVAGFAVGDRVFGAAIGKAVADYVVVQPVGALWHTPEGVSDEVASTLSVAGMTASAAVDAVDLQPGDVVLIGAAAGGVGVFATQLARLAGATVIGTASEGTFDFLRGLGARPVAYGAGLVEQVREIAPAGVTAAIDLFGTETVEAALALGVAPQRIAVVAVGTDLPEGVHATGAAGARPENMDTLTAAIASGVLTVPIAAGFPVDEIRDAVTLQAQRHVHGKIVVHLR